MTFGSWGTWCLLVGGYAAQQMIATIASNEMPISTLFLNRITDDTESSEKPNGLCVLIQYEYCHGYNIVSIT
jgi:hypothetical protein